MLQFDSKLHPIEIAVVAICSAAATTALGTIAMPLPRGDRAAEFVLPPQVSNPPKSPPAETAELFVGGERSIVSRAVGHAEGTRGADGSKTPAYAGHTDPGNGVWNLGSFSYQHSASSPEDADRKQLARLQRQFALISQQALAKGLRLSFREKLNAIDLANQAPRAALEPGGFVDRLIECNRELVCVRSKSYLDLDGRLDAPGLGNNMRRVERDQQRRIDAIDNVIKTMRS
jgi:hypothetical protein